jgi:hypothetical protein
MEVVRRRSSQPFELRVERRGVVEVDVLVAEDSVPRRFAVREAAFDQAGALACERHLLLAIETRRRPTPGQRDDDGDDHPQARRGAAETR